MEDPNKEKKIALLVNSFWGSRVGISGGEQRVGQIFQRINFNYKIDIYTNFEGMKAIEKKFKNASFFLSPSYYDKFGLFVSYLMRSVWAKACLTKREGYDVIYTNSDFFSDILPAFAYKRKNPKVGWIACVFHIYPSWLKRPGNKITNLIGSLTQNWSLKKIKLAADKIININYQVHDELVNKYNFDKDKIIVSSCGIDLKYFKNIKTYKKDYQACFIARLVPSKGIFDLAEIWSVVVKNIPEAKLKIIGGGNDDIKTKLKETFQGKKIETNVEILGFLPNDEAYKILKESNVFVFPSHEEGFGIVIAEAFACGTPCVAWDLPVYNEIFPDVLLTAREGDIKDFASKVVDVMKNQKFAQSLSVSGCKYIKKYGWEKIAELEQKIISSLIKEKND